MKFKRKQEISALLEPKSVLVIYGPRRVGKTTLLNEYVQSQSGKKIFSSTGDDILLRQVFQSEQRNRILDFARPYDLIAIDEAQFIPSIGLGAKMMIDAFPEKMFIIKKVRGFSRDLRNEISKKPKYYFLDNGVRNAVISQFNPLDSRNDIGALWENFIFMELFKKSGIAGAFDNYYFWRTHTGQEIDIIKESNGILSAIECKWSKNSVTAPALWQTTYPDAGFDVIHKDNYLDFLL